MIKHIIFDLDGVLFDGCDLHADIFTKAVNKVKPELKLTREYHDSKLNALSTKKKIEVLNIYGLEAEQIYNLKQQMTRAYLENNISKNEKNIEICEKLLKLNYKIYCVSNSIRTTLETVLSGMGIQVFLTGIVSSDDTPEPKPSPLPYLTLYEKYNINPLESLIIEDSECGIISASKSGANVLSVRNCNDVTLPNILKAIEKIEPKEGKKNTLKIQNTIRAY